MPTTTNIPSITKISVKLDGFCYIKMRVSQSLLRPQYLETLGTNGFDFNLSGSEHLLGRVEKNRFDSFMTALAQNRMISDELISKWETHRETILAQGSEYTVLIFDPSERSVGFFSGSISRERRTPIISWGALVDPRLFQTPGITPLGFEREERLYGGHIEPISDEQLLAESSSEAGHLRLPEVGTNAEKIRELGIPHEEIPKEYICPLSLSIMTHPVRLNGDKTGTVFERAWIEYWIQNNRAPAHPLTRQPIVISDIEPDNELEAQIEAFLAYLTERSALKLS